MRLDNMLDEMVGIIKSDDYFNGIKVIKAYPFDVKPTRFACPYIALGLCEIDMHSISVDSAQRAGTVSVFADIYVSWKKDGAVIYDIFTRLCKVLSCFNVLSIKTQRMEYDTYTQANKLESVITFSDEIAFGGALNE